MAVEWIKKNMLLFNNEHDKQSAEAELKVQLSLQEPSTSNCYLDKRSNSPKILNVMSTKHRVSWRNPFSKRNYTPDSSSSDSIDISEHVKENVNEKTKKVAPPIIFHKNEVFCQQMLPETNHTRSSTKSSSPMQEILDVNIPIKKFPRRFFKTFPKMSPSRKIQNINIVLPLGPKNEFTKDFKDMCNDDYGGDDTKKTFVLKERPFNVDRTIKTEDLKNVNVIIDKGKENRQKSASFQASQIVTTPLNAPDAKSKFKLRDNSTPNFSQGSLVSSDIIEHSPKEKILSPNILEKSLIFENKSMNVSDKSENIRRSKKISPNLLEKTSTFKKSSVHNSFQESSNPTDLELPLQSKQLNRKKNIVKKIVRDLDEKARKSLQPRHSQDDDKERFVKRIVNALEKVDIPRRRSISSRRSINGEDSPSESETKSCVTSNSPKDTDYSDDGQRSPTLNSDDDQTSNSAYCKEDTLEVKKKDTEDDSVHWISIPKSTLPRSSSLLSISNELSNYIPSPCISPIKSPNEVEYSLTTSWGATYKTSNALCKKLFHETGVIDSGYSD